MANKIIGDLTAVTTVTKTDLVELQITAGPASRKCTLENMMAGNVPSYTVATLPAADVNVAIATDGRKDGEGSGAGTGVLCYRTSTTWYRVSDDTAVVA